MATDIRKKTAMDSLGAIEQCFATLRDKCVVSTLPSG